jgi:nucleoside-diphosphate-sugar epimerase
MLVPELAEQAGVDEIVGLARRMPRWEVPKVSWRSVAVERDDLRAAFAGADAVVHLVWIIQPSRDPERQRIVNVVGTERVLAAAADAGVKAVIHASSVGAYSPGPRDHAVDESWPTAGNGVLAYAWQKAYAERLLDRFEQDQPSVRVVRLRPALVMQRGAGHEVKSYFLGPIVPPPVVRPRLLLAVLDRGPLRLQAVHASDVGRAFAMATVSDVSGAFNVAAPDVVGVDRPALVPAVSRLAGASFAARLQPTSSGWVKAAAALPIMDTARIQRELGWSATWSARDAVGDLLAGIRDDATGPTPALA